MLWEWLADARRESGIVCRDGEGVAGGGGAKAIKLNRGVNYRRKPSAYFGLASRMVNVMKVMVVMMTLMLMVVTGLKTVLWEDY